MTTTLRRLYRGLEALYGVDSGIDPHAHLLLYEPSADGRQELVLLRETDDALELSLALDARTVHRMEREPADQALSDERLGETLPVLEGLSHLLYLAEAARCERPVSGLELETQAEVDKVAMCLLHRWGARDPEHGHEALVRRLLHHYTLVPSLDATERERYETANRVAVGLWDRLRPTVRTSRLGDLRRHLRRFWHAPMGEKRRLAASRR